MEKIKEWLLLAPTSDLTGADTHQENNFGA